MRADLTPFRSAKHAPFLCRPAAYAFALVSVGAVLSLAGCSKPQRGEQDLPPELRNAVLAIARQQSAAFTNGTCTIRQAFRYTGPLPYPERSTNAFLALIVEISGYKQGFDFDDIDLIDADTQENLGSNPGIWPLKSDGTADTSFADLPAAPGPATVLLLYERSKLPKHVKLSYWDSVILKEALEVSENERGLFKSK